MSIPRVADGSFRTICLVTASALLLGVAAYAAPNGADEALRGTGKGSTGVTRLVTGDPARINDVIAGTPPTAILAITPVQPPAAATPVNSYPAGCTIVGQELRCDRIDIAGFRAWFNVQVLGWDPAGDGPNAITYQLQIGCYSYADSDCPGDQPDLLPAGWASLPTGWGIPCSNATICRETFGESFAKCTGGFCDAGYIDADGTGRPDSFCAAPEACSNTGVAIGKCGFNYFAGSGSTLGTVDRGFVYHGGTLVLDIPAGAKGKYTVLLNTDETFVASPGTPPVHVPSLVETGFIVNLVTGSCCFGLGTPDAGCVDNCIIRSDCDALPGPRVFTPGEKCPPLGPPCLIPYGACCNTLNADCEEQIEELDCRGTHLVWTSGASCDEAPCTTDTGACCSRDPFGPCTDDTVLSDCLCPTCTWHKLQACDEIECAPTPIPTASEWGLTILTLLLLIGAKIYFGRSGASRCTLPLAQ